jgi:hypothetical protein
MVLFNFTSEKDARQHHRKTSEDKHDPSEEKGREGRRLHTNLNLSRRGSIASEKRQLWQQQILEGIEGDRTAARPDEALSRKVEECSKYLNCFLLQK